MLRLFRFAPALLLSLSLTACIFGGGEKKEARPAPRPGGHYTTPELTSRAAAQCHADLRKGGYAFRELPDRDYGGGCELRDAVQLLDIGVPVTGLKSMRCDLAEKFSNWITHGVRPAAIQILGSDIVRVETFGTYACRNIRGSASSSGKISEHARANAVDVSGFVLADGRRITVEKDWKSSDPAVRRFMEVIHKSACRRFQTVLSPDYNAAHYNHFHLDMGRGPFCR